MHGHRGFTESGRDATTNAEQCYLWQKRKLYFWDENKLRSDIAAEYAYKALVSVAEMSKQYNTIIELLNNIAISEHGNTHEQTE